MNHHIIYKQKATVMVAKEAQAHTIQNEISDVMKHELPQLLQDVFDSINPGGDIIRIDSLHLDLGILPEQNTGHVFKERVAEKIKEAIILSKKNGTSETGVDIIHKQQSLREAFLYFLQTGTKPWFMRTKNRKTWENEMQQAFAPNDWQKIVLWLRQNYQQHPAIIERLTLQFSDKVLEAIISHSVPFGNETWEDVYADLRFLFARQKRVNLLSLCLISFLNTTSLPDALYDVLKNSIKTGAVNLNISSEIPGPVSTTKIIADIFQRLKTEENISLKGNKKEEISKYDIILPGKLIDPTNIEPQYVSNCGIVLLHPFLELYFAEFALLNKRKFIDDNACRRAVLLLHYLATGETEGEEWNLLLQKMMCGLSSGETLPGMIDITRKEKEETEKLLQSVINYCPPLKNTSTAGLRSTFLQRDGRLEKKENGWLLTVEQKTVDILLDKLPWGFSTIRLPWLKDMISVDWC